MRPSAAAPSATAAPSNSISGSGGGAGVSWRLCDVPHSVFERLCRLLDRTCWRHLAGQHLNYSQDDIEFLEYRERHGFSPSRHVLQQWKQQDPLVDELFVMLSRMRFYQAMHLIAKYVDGRLLALLHDGEGSKSSVLRAMRQRRATDSEPGEAVIGGRHASPSATAAATTVAQIADRTDKHWQVGGALAGNLAENAHKSDLPTKLARDDIVRLLRAPVEASLSASSIPSMAGFDSARPSGNENGRRQQQERQQPVITTDINDSVLSLSATDLAAGGRIVAGSDAGGGGASSPSTSVKLPDATAAGIDMVRRDDQLVNIPRIEYAALRAGTDNWSSERVLGSGGFGTVYRATWKNTTWAVKRIAVHTSTAVGGGGHEQQLAELRRSLDELRILNTCRHDNILPVCGFSVDGPEPLLLYQLMAGGSLLDRLVCRRVGVPPLDWRQRLNIARGSARGLQFLHTRTAAPLVHGDIKSANILLDSHLEPRLGDFGLARQLPASRYTSLQVSRIHGTRPYLPDEYLRSRRLSDKVDTYSFGVVLYEIGSGQPAYDERRPVKLLRRLVEEAAAAGLLRRLADRRPDWLDAAVFDALMRLGAACVQQRPRQRPPMTHVLAELETAVAAAAAAMDSGGSAVTPVLRSTAGVGVCKRDVSVAACDGKQSAGSSGETTATELLSVGGACVSDGQCSEQGGGAVAQCWPVEPPCGRPHSDDSASGGQNDVPPFSANCLPAVIADAFTCRAVPDKSSGISCDNERSAASHCDGVASATSDEDSLASLLSDSLVLYDADVTVAPPTRQPDALPLLSELGVVHEASLKQ